jgi:hypothetical protein
MRKGGGGDVESRVRNDGVKEWRMGASLPLFAPLRLLERAEGRPFSSDEDRWLYLALFSDTRTWAAPKRSMGASGGVASKPAAWVSSLNPESILSLESDLPAKIKTVSFRWGSLRYNECGGVS